MEDPVIDDFDLDLIAALQTAPRASFDVLARVLDSSARTVARRYARLVDAGTMRVICETEWSLLAEGLPATVWIGTEPGRAPEVARALAARADTPFVSLASGAADIFCMLHGPTRADTTRALTTELPALPGVRTLRTEWMLRRLTSTSAWRLPRLTSAQITALAGQNTGVPAVHPRHTPLSGLERDTAAALRNDARMPFSTLARTLGITESRARRTVAALLESGLLRPRVEVDPRDLGYAVEAVLSIGCRPGAVQRLAASLAGHPTTRFLALTAAASLFTHVGLFRDEEHLADFLTGGFEGSDDITSLECSLQLEVLKRYWTPRP
ncbi:Lrp/AsnC family transcriptional regulator [Streptomyces kronopolitis]|uniref:Lrp/AsnC family transcriptional regulator n=1 Tax=Streptomyces kronopolitis TaxID=1612435 RepID=UPI0036A63736